MFLADEEWAGIPASRQHPDGYLIRMHNGRVLSDSVFGGALSGRSETSRNI